MDQYITIVHTILKPPVIIWYKIIIDVQKVFSVWYHGNIMKDLDDQKY